MIRLQTLGTLDVTLDGGAAPAPLLWKKNVALLLYLAHAPKQRCTREQLIGLLWPEKDDAAARQSVREAIRVLRQYLGEAQLKTTGDVIQLLEGAVELDTDRFEQLARQHAWAQTTPLINGEFVHGFKIPDASGFEDWLTVERAHWHGRAMEALLAHVEERLDAGDELGADEPFRRARIMDPLSQRAVRAQLRRLGAAGDRSGALHVFEQFLEDSGPDVIVEAETQALIERLRSGRAWHLPREALAPDRGVAWRRTPLLGRQRELAAALAQWRIAKTGRLALLVVEAEAGGGKTRLVEELVTRLGLDGGVVVAMRAVPSDAAHPGSAMLSLARGGLVHAPGVAGASPAALATLAAHASEWAERFPQRHATSAGGVETAIAEVLRVTSAERPHVLVLDDGQWIDAPSYEMIERLTRDLPRAPILIVIATTPEPAPPKLTELRSRIGRDLAGATVTLGALTAAGIRELVQWALPSYPGDSADRLVRRVAVDSAGLPLLAVEMCHAVAQGLDLETISDS